MNALVIDADQYEMVAEKVRASGSSFYWGMRLLSRPRRFAMYAVYAFCREVDDIADEPGEPETKRAQLAEWRVELDRLYQGKPTHPVAVALAGPVAEFGLPKEDFRAVIEGCEMDGRNEMVRPSMDKLNRYCDCVASAVGRLSIRVFGEMRPRSIEVANATGMALQLTNILRDVAVDAAIGRLYLPDELLTKHGIATSDPMAVLAHPNLGAVCRELGETARGYFRASDQAMAECLPAAMRPATLMKEMYREIFHKVEAEGFIPRDPPVKVSKVFKIWCILRHGLF
ncbi:squalene synthase HpnD [Paramagnetospirillum kuznetsovii]|uniref:Squalene synthase HpnD n=1 Tax=Paramagnetospirillum kuznetsovii TaxID=2053833 RepID=A0A364NU49_9PROT|nr:presqualene diphosphate synthase HpnD [Paramagnetospirillum kuznetsovii]RAU20397.1 squalene synthase HpnD [Paramagnetospirillum kuznetsovii]